MDTHARQHIALRQRLGVPGGYRPRSSLPSFIRRTLIFSLISVSRRSGQKQSSAGAITTSRGIPQITQSHAEGKRSFRCPHQTQNKQNQEKKRPQSCSAGTPACTQSSVPREKRRYDNRRSRISADTLIKSTTANSNEKIPMQ